GQGDWRQVLPLGFAGLLVWGLWLYRFVLSRRAKPVYNDFRATTSVVVPSYREDPEILLRGLRTWLDQGPNEVIIVPDVGDKEVIDALARVSDPRLRVLPIPHEGKRPALCHGIRHAQHDILVLSDSDTFWRRGLL